MTFTRPATHSGSWYPSDPTKLNKDLDRYLQEAEVDLVPKLRFLIAPHAGYSYSGPTAAYAYRAIDPNEFNRIFLLGPSHRIAFQGAALTRSKYYATPFGDVAIDRQGSLDSN
jgi:AmmeMemoRadiSam system protein B